MRRPKFLIATAGMAVLLAGLCFAGPAASATGATVPSPPTGLSAVPSDTTITLSWVAPANGGSAILGYNIYQGTTSGGESATPVNGSTLVVPTTATVTGLANAKTYYFTVKAVNSIGASAASNETWAITAATVPGAPSKVVATGADASATVTWSAANAGGSNISRYAVTAIDATVASRGGQSCIWTTGTLTCLVLGLTDGDSYSFSVTATNSLGTGPVSSPSNSVVPAPTAPSAPVSVVATPGNTTIVLSWTAPTNGGAAITGYNLYEGTKAGMENYSTPVNGATLISGTTTTVTGLVNDSKYYFTLKAVNAIGSSAASSEVWAIPAGIVPGAPTKVGAVRGFGSATVTWTAPSSLGGSAILRYNVLATDSTLSTRGGQTCTWTTGPLTCLVSGLTNGDSYTFTVTATNSVGTSVASGPSGVVVPSPTAPAAPTSLTAVPTNTAIVLRWVAPTDDGSAITGYNVYEGTSSGGESATPVNGSVLISGTEVTVSGLLNGHTYYFKAKAVNGAGFSPASSEVWAIPAATVPGAPMSVTATYPGVASAIVTWQAPLSSGGAAITGYTVTPYIGTAAQVASTFSSNATTETITGLNPGTAYTFTVAAINVLGTGPASAPSGTASLLRSPTVITLVLSHAKLTYGHERVENFSVAVVAKYSSTTPTGTVAIKKSTTTLCEVKLSSGRGFCTMSGAKLHAGTYSVYATYPRDTSFWGSTSPKKDLTVSKASTKTGLKLSEVTLGYGHEQRERLTVTVAPQYSSTFPTGTVTVSGSACRIQLSAGKGSCNLSANTFHPGAHQLVATYWGSGNFLGSTSSKKGLNVIK